ncbi:MAG: MBL fold metallo-hydrolase, partial [Archaeoglobaceae archaeon]
LEARLEIYKSIVLERDKRIRELIALGKDPVGKGVIYRRFPEPKQIYEHFERIMVKKHLEMR